MAYSKQTCPECGKETVYDNTCEIGHCIHCGKQVAVSQEKYKVTFTTDSFGATGSDIFYFYIDGVECVKAKKKEEASATLTKGIHRVDITVTSKRLGLSGTCCINVTGENTKFKTSFNNLLPTLIPIEDFE